MNLRKDHSQEQIKPYHCESPAVRFRLGLTRTFSRCAASGRDLEGGGDVESGSSLRRLSCVSPGVFTLITNLVHFCFHSSAFALAVVRLATQFHGITTFSDGCLGSSNDEGRSEV